MGGNPAWTLLFAPHGIGVETALRLMAVIGTVDILLALSILLKPLRIVLIWMVFWTLVTALARPIAGQSWLDFLERGANIAAPLALLSLRAWPRSWRDLFS